MIESIVPQLVNKKGGSYSAIDPQLEVDGLFKPKTTKGANKPEAQWSNDEKRVVNQNQRLKSIIISCLPDDIMEGGALAESFQFSESAVGVSCNTYGSTVHSTTDHNDFKHFKRGEKLQATKTREPIKRIVTGVNRYLHKWCQAISTQICGATRPISPMSINHEKYTQGIVDDYSRYTWVHFLKKNSQTTKVIMSFIRMVENQNDVKVKQIRTDNGTEFRNQELKSFCDEKGIYQNFSLPYKPEQNVVAERKNRTLIKAARTMLNGSVLSKHFWMKADRLGKFDAKADDGYFLGYSFISKAFKVFNIGRQQVEETYHVTFDESIEAFSFTNTLVDEIRINGSYGYPLDEYLHGDDPSRQYQANSNISYYITPHNRSLTKLIKITHVPEVIIHNE
nr:hypothetical protein [Tanacetum cinerariifolium]